MPAIACTLCFLALAAGSWGGQPLSGFVFPVGPGLVIGAGLLGIGMQQGAGCGSGTFSYRRRRQHAAGGHAPRLHHRPYWKEPGLRAALESAVLDGLPMGYGARLSFGCDIGALVGGIASGSLHGRVWPVAAFAGSAVGVRLRRHVRLA